MQVDKPRPLTTNASNKRVTGASPIRGGQVLQKPNPRPATSKPTATIPPAPMLPKPNSPVVEVVRNRLYWYSGSKPPSSNTEAYFFSVDDELEYDPFNEDFGPLSLAQVHKYIRELVRLLVDPDYKNVKLYHYCSNTYDK